MLELDEMAAAAAVYSHLALLLMPGLVCSETYNLTLEIPLKLKKHYKITHHSSEMVCMLDETMYTI